MIRVTIDRVVVEGLNLGEKEIRRRLEAAFERLDAALIDCGGLPPLSPASLRAPVLTSFGFADAGTRASGDYGVRQRSLDDTLEREIARVVREAFDGG